MQEWPAEFAFDLQNLRRMDGLRISGKLAEAANPVKGKEMRT
jgi:hypothetical protein